MAEPDQELSSSGAGQRLGAPETLGISTLDPTHKPPAMPSGRHVTIRVRMLDDTEELFDISQKASGKVLFDLVCSHMNLIEGDYFGLEFQNQQKMMVWLDHIKPIIKQLKRPKHTILQFSVKFFPPDHAQLLEELTRYLFALQIKQDLSCGRLTCNDTSAALIVSHIIQSEIGDFEESHCRSHLLNNNYIPDQMPLIDKIMESHSKHLGQSPAESDYHLLEVARKLEMYGIRLHPAKDREGTKLSLAVAHTGVLVFQVSGADLQGHTRINAFNWSKIRKLSFKRKRFLIKLRPDLNSSYQDTLEFLMASRDCCKVFWKICVEYHAFFRLFEEPKPKPKPVLFTRGSSFRFSGRTQKQVIDYVRESEFKKIPFDRKHSRVQHNTRIQLNSRPSPLSSPRHREEPTESGAPEDRLGSPSQRHWKESALVSAEDPLASRTTRASPSQQRNGHDDRKGSMSNTDETRGPARQTHLDHLSQGPACWAATNSRSTFSGSNREFNKSREKAGITDRGSKEQVVFGRSSGSGTQLEQFLGRMQPRESPPPSRASLDMNFDLDQGLKGSRQKSDYNKERQSSSSVPGPHKMGSRSSVTIPLQASSIPHSEQNGYVPQLYDDGRCSPLPSRSSQSQKSHKRHHQFNTTPHQGASPLSPEPCPVMSRAERMAVLERRMKANGLSAPGKSRPSQRRLAQAGGTHMGAVQMSEDFTTSGSESSESEIENKGTCSSPLSGSLVEANSSIPRNKFSFGSLQLDEDADEDGCHNFSDEDGGQIFSC